MQFRWVALITLWTLLIGPVVGGASRPASSARKSAVHSARMGETKPRKLPRRVQRYSPPSEERMAANALRWQLIRRNEKAPGENTARLGQTTSYRTMPSTNR